MPYSYRLRFLRLVFLVHPYRLINLVHWDGRARGASHRAGLSRASYEKNDTESHRKWETTGGNTVNTNDEYMYIQHSGGSSWVASNGHIFLAVFDIQNAMERAFLKRKESAFRLSIFFFFTITRPALYGTLPTEGGYNSSTTTLDTYYISCQWVQKKVKLCLLIVEGPNLNMNMVLWSEVQ